jgi:hypothetical protein
MHNNNILGGVVPSPREVVPIMMKRFFFAAGLLLVGVGTASADFVLIKVDLNKINLFPAVGGGMMGQAGGGPGGPPPGGLPPPPPPGNFGGGFGGFNGGMPPPKDPKNPGGPPVIPDDPNAKWVTAVVEIKSHPKLSQKNPVGMLWAAEHKWSARPGFLPYSPLFMWVSPVVDAKPFVAEFTSDFLKEDKDYNANKDKEKVDRGRYVDNFMHLARKALSRGQLKEFHKVMAKVKEIDGKHPVVKNYVRVEKFLKLPLKNEDPAQYELLQEMKQGYKEFVSKRGHYCIYAQTIGADRQADVIIARRLALMEETLEVFYYWFAVQRDTAVQPNFPKYRLNAILAGSKEEFKTRHLQWGSVPMVADGFTPRRDNVIVMSSKVRLNDPLYNELDTLINQKILEANQKLEQHKISFTRDELLNGKIFDNKAASNSMIVAAAQTLVLLAKTLEDGAERHTVTSETVRQLLIASDMFPRNVQLPDWMIEGLAALFETPDRSVYPTIGAPSWTHAISFKHLRTKTQKLAVPRDVLYNVIRDFYFQDARQFSKDLQEQPGSPELQRGNREAWELARSTAWSFTYYLAQKGKLDYLFAYGKELDRLPRDMDLNEQILEASFAKAFNMADAQDAGKVDNIKMYNMAGSWFTMMEGINLEPAVIQSYYEKERAKLDPQAPAPPPIPNPNADAPPPPPNNDPQQPVNLVNTTWGGNETLPGYGPLTFQFTGDTQATMTDKDGNSQGSYTQMGNNVTLKFKGSVTYTGTINGNTMQGTATNTKTTWNWTVTRDAAANGALNPNAHQGPRPPNVVVRPPPPPRVIIRRP